LIEQKVKGKTIDRQEVITTLRNQCKSRFEVDCKELGIYLTRFNGEQGIVRCKHTEKDRTIELLKSINTIASQKVGIETLGTSGTIKALIKKHMSK